jgi:tetratricopeptide (TPR) repeat protein
MGQSQRFQAMGEFDQMVASALAAVAFAPSDRAAAARLVECQIYNGRIDAAVEVLLAQERAAHNDPGQLQQVATLYMHCSRFSDAHRCYERCTALRAQDPGALYNLASSCVSMGQIDRAEEIYNRVIALRRDDFDAYQNRSTLRSWSAADNHIDELKTAFRKLPDDHSGRVALGYALAKEYEDLRDYPQAFGYLVEGANSRRQRMAYKVRNDVTAMDKIRTVFSAEVLSSQQTGPTKDASLFVLGLPRSGTTLVDRILCSHSQVQSLGEINAFAFALMKHAGSGGDKLAMIERSSQLDFSQLGNSYRSAIQSYGIEASLLLNKTPSNYLYMGLIHLALPSAKTVHLRRHPMDSCYAMFKTLFRMGYPFSYSLEDIGHYYLAYHRLMQHWSDTIPKSFHSVSYEQLVDQQVNVSRGLLQYCGLSWEEACVDFHNNAAPAATASAVQVRRPLYRSSVQMWRNYEAQLAPLAAFLQNHGVDCH